MILSASLKTVASAILADVELGFQPGGKNAESTDDPVKSERFRNAGDFSGRQDAATFRPGSKQEVTPFDLRWRKQFDHVSVRVTKEHLPRAVRPLFAQPKIRAQLMEMILPRIQFIHSEREMITAIAR